MTDEKDYYYELTEPEEDYEYYHPMIVRPQFASSEYETDTEEEKVDADMFVY